MTSPIKTNVRTLLEPCSDTKGVITDDFIDRLTGQLDTINTVRDTQDIKPYSPLEAVMFVRSALLAADIHFDQIRDTGESYHDVHLAGTVDNLVTVLGRTRPVLLAAGGLHDSGEDQGVDRKELKSRILSLFPEASGEESVKIREFASRVSSLVDGVTKDKKGKKEEIAAKSFLKLLEAMLRWGVDEGFLRIGERLNNVETLEGKKNEYARKRIAKDTYDIYVRLAEVLAVKPAIRRLVDPCARYLNERLLTDFTELRNERLGDRDLQTALSEANQPSGPGSKDLRRFLKKHVPIFEMTPFSLADFVLSDPRSLEEIDISDLSLHRLTPLGDIRVIVKPLEDCRQHDDGRYIRDIEPLIEKARRYVLRCFKGPGERHEIEPVSEELPRVGEIIRIFSKRLGLLQIRINSIRFEARLPRGMHAPRVGSNGKKSDVEIPPDLEASIGHVLNAAGQLDHIENALPLARAELLHPTITVYTPRFKAIKLPHGATVLDFAARIYSDLLVGLQTARLLNPGQPAQQIGIFDQLKNGDCVEVESCLGKGNRDTSKVKVDPRWLLFCETREARTILRRYLSKNPSEAGNAYLKHITTVFHLSVREIVQAIRDNTPRMKRVTQDYICEQIAQGDLDLLRFISSIYFQKYRWTIIVELPDIPGAYRNFLAEFETRGINIYHIQQHLKREGQPDSMTMVIEDQRGIKTPFDMMKILLKLSSSYALSVQPSSSSVS